MTALFKAPQLPGIKPTPPMPDSQNPAVLDILARAGRSSTILTTAAGVGQNFSAADDNAGGQGTGAAAAPNHSGKNPADAAATQASFGDYLWRATTDAFRRDRLANGRSLTADMGDASPSGQSSVSAAESSDSGNPANGVALACRDVRGLLGLGTHCGLFVTDSNGELQHQFPMGYGDSQFNQTPRTFLDDSNAFRSGVRVYWIAPPPAMPGEEFASRVVNYAQHYRAPFSLLHRNSNSAAAYPVIMSGGQLPAVQGAGVEVRALDYWLNNPPPGDW